MSPAQGCAVRTTRTEPTARRIRRRPGVYFSLPTFFCTSKRKSVGDKPKHTGKAKMERKKEFEPWKFEANSIGSKLSRTVVRERGGPPNRPSRSSSIRTSHPTHCSNTQTKDATHTWMPAQQWRWHQSQPPVYHPTNSTNQKIDLNPCE